MERELTLGIDAGTAGVRAGLFDLQGQPLGFSSQSYQTSYPQPGWATQHPADWWNALVHVVQHCLKEHHVDGQRVVGLAIDAPCNILLTSQDGTPLTEGLMWMDLRATSQARLLTETHDPVLRYCGGDVPAEWPIPKVLWLKQYASALWQQQSYLVDQMGWLTWKLTGAWAVPLNSAAAKWHYRATSTNETPAGWPTHLLESVGLGDMVAKIPGKVLPMGAPAGELTPTVAQLLGLRAGIAVSMSGIDAHAGMVGMNVLAPGSLALITGTSTCQLIQSAEPVIDAGLWGPFESAVVNGAWTIEAGQASTGGTVRWLLDTLGGTLPPGDERYEVADAAAAAIKPGADGLTVLDFWQGSRTPIKDPQARGTIWGLTPAHTPGHLLRAVYEGTAYGNCHILEKFAQLNLPTQNITACGGGTRSPLWLQILADTAGLPITLTTEPDAVTLGSAICAAVGAGAFPDLHAAARSMVHVGKTIESDAATYEVYQEGYSRYKATYEALKPLFKHTS